MTNLTYAQLEGVWLQAAAGTKYDTQAWAALMAAIALAESSGNADATNPTDNGGTQTSWGLWQISLGNHNEPSPNWNNPVTNAQLAIGKLNSQGLSAWGTYDSGAYKQYLNGSTTPDSNFPSSAGATLADNVNSAPNTGGSTACLIGFPGFAGIGSFCVLSKAQARGIIGVGLMGAGIGIGMLGLLVLTASVFAQSGAGHTAGGALETAGAGLAFIPGAEGAGLALGATGAAARRAGGRTAGRQSLDRRAARRAQAKTPAKASPEASPETSAGT